MFNMPKALLEFRVVTKLLLNPKLHFSHKFDRAALLAANQALEGIRVHDCSDDFKSNGC